MKPQVLKNWAATTFELNGKTWPCEYRVLWEYDQEPIEGSFDFGDEAENSAYMDRFERGELSSLNVIVEARADGVTGGDALCAIHVAGLDDLLEVVAGDCMIRNAADALAAKIKQTYDALEKYR